MTDTESYELTGGEQDAIKLGLRQLIDQLRRDYNRDENLLTDGEKELLQDGEQAMQKMNK